MDPEDEVRQDRTADDVPLEEDDLQGAVGGMYMDGPQGIAPLDGFD